MKKNILLFTLLLFSILAYSANRTWDGGGDGHSWNDKDNWSNNKVPVAGDDAIFNGGTVTVDGTASSAIRRLQIKGGADVTLNLDLDIGDNALNYHSIQFMSGGGTLKLGSGYTFNLNPPGATTKHGVYLQNAPATFNNNGTVVITSAQDGINNADGTVNNSGTITINNAAQDGIENKNTFNNSGTITIDNAASKGIYNRPLATFNNTSTINITNVASGNDGIRTESTFNNESTGSITVDASSGDDCISLNGGTFTNDGSIDLTANGTSSTNNGLVIGENGEASTFINTSNNSLTINGGVDPGRAVRVQASGTLENTGTITLSGGKPAYRFYSEGTVENQKGGTMDVGAGQFRVNGGTFTNDGLLKSDWGKGLVDGGATTTNNGFVDWTDVADFDSNPGVSLTDGSGEVTAIGCDVDIAEVDYHWDENDPLTGSSGWDAAGDGTFTIGNQEVKNNPPTVVTQEYGTDVQIKIKELCSTAFPIELLYFSGKTSRGANIINWSTLTESNTDYFEVEKSTDGKYFEEIGVVKAEGNSRTQKDYTFEDYKDIDGVRYYRLKTYDLDGTFATSRTIQLTAKSNNAVFSLFPTKLRVGDKLNIVVNGKMDKNATLAIYNNAGIRISTKSISDNTTISIDNKFKPGMYFGKFYNNNKTLIKKFFIIK